MLAPVRWPEHCRARTYLLHQFPCRIKLLRRGNSAEWRQRICCQIDPAKASGTSRGDDSRHDSMPKPKYEYMSRSESRSPTFSPVAAWLRRGVERCLLRKSRRPALLTGGWMTLVTAPTCHWLVGLLATSSPNSPYQGKLLSRTSLDIELRCSTGHLADLARLSLCQLVDDQQIATTKATAQNANELQQTRSCLVTSERQTPVVTLCAS